MTTRITIFSLILIGSFLNLSLPDKSPSSWQLAKHNERHIRAGCSTCHLFPEPEIASGSAWLKVLPEMIRRTRSPGVLLPDDESIKRFFLKRAVTPNIANESSPIDDSFEKSNTTLFTESYRNSEISFLLQDPTQNENILICDIKRSGVFVTDTSSNTTNSKRLAEINVPVHAAVCDLDKNGIDDIIISDLGQLPPDDINSGGVTWLRNKKDGSSDLIPILTGIGRVAQTRIDDIDGDGFQDIIVAEFGFEKTGGLHVLWNDGAHGESPKFKSQTLDSRAGAVSIATSDMDGDGDTDIIVAFAQNHEEIVLFINRGNKQFEPKVLYKAPHPAWGLMDLLTIDLDSDGNVDVLSVNGDHLDGMELKDYHGLYWSRNNGDGTFETQLIVSMPGATRVRMTDVDGDSDSDLILVALLSPMALPSNMVGEISLETLIWLENRGSGKFSKHIVAKDARGFSDVIAIDLNGDGKRDLIGSRLNYVDFASNEGSEKGEMLEVYLNRN